MADYDFERMDYIELYNSIKNDLHSIDDNIINKAIYKLLMNLSYSAKSFNNGKDFIDKMKESCAKWNEIRYIDLKEFNETNLAYDGFRTYWINQVPELKYIVY